MLFKNTLREARTAEHKKINFLPFSSASFLCFAVMLLSFWFITGVFLRQVETIYNPFYFGFQVFLF